MSPAGGGVRAGLDLARAGNFPSVASNVLAALVLASPAAAAPEAGRVAGAVLAGGLVYAGGATLNDVCDAAFDRQHQPHRPIAAGRITHGAAAAIGALELLAGAALLLGLGVRAGWIAGLLVVIAAYDVLHKRWRGSVLLMAGCRLLLALAVGSLPGLEFTRPFLVWACGLSVYIVALSMLARREQAPGAPALGRWVRLLLAGIPLVDAAALAAVGAWIPAVACAAAFPLGRWAQRVAASA